MFQEEKGIDGICKTYCTMQKLTTLQGNNAKRDLTPCTMKVETGDIY